MRYIKKGQEPQSFTDWKSQENDDWKPTYKTLRGQIKAEVHDALLEEQSYTCCYCGMSITRNISHIEHLQPQNDKTPNLPKDLALAIDFTNLLASCGIPEKSNLEYEKILHCVYHCGIKKGNNLLAVHPLQPDCDVFFRYLLIPQGEEYDVEILPTEEPDKQQLAADTIKTLNLNYSKLIAMRGSAIKGALEAIEGLTQEEIEIFIKSYEQPNQQAFSFAIAYILKQFLDPN
ncbi:retron system putative HNH endonuclease [Pseudanabaena sp. 'Roaring Creek']|uniref:retron system putative HNH endonuclease n=1 Tax=Pseudanabaena sp. 'Roaring Creek' TaxID=1681830 RepID=UPI0006D82752|nr:retron system putative HNH endonuclease [Pseudanabaena sp. 'Roaring Creek']